MKLCIYMPDGSNAEVPFKNVPSSLEKINSDILLCENFMYKLVIRADNIDGNIELYVGDYSVPLLFNTNTGCYETEKELIFNGCFDLISLSIYITDENGKDDCYYTDYLRIATTKQTVKQVELMLNEIEENLPNFLEICFSKSKKQSGLIKNDFRSIWNTLKILDDIITIYDENYGCFSNHKKTVVEQAPEIVDVKSMRKIDLDSLIWITDNPDKFIPCKEDGLIKYHDKNYKLSKIKTSVQRYSYDVYENRVVLGFLKNVINYIETQISGFNREMNKLENIPDSIIRQIPNTHELTGRSIYIYYKGVANKFTQKKDILLSLFYKYEKMLNCKSEDIFSTPRLTNSFKQIYHYRVCYECMVRWFEEGDYSFKHINYLFRLKTLSRIFEYYCLIKLQKAIIACGFSYVKGTRIQYNIEDDEQQINNQYLFSGSGQNITLFYEPSIWVNRLNGNMNLFSTGYNFVKNKWNDRWTPDFVIKIQIEDKEYYYILDAKYSSEKNVKKRYISELVLKYSTQIASKDKFYSDVIGVGAIYPGCTDTFYDFKKNKVSSNRESLPKYFSLAIMDSQKGDDALTQRLSALLGIVDDVEKEIRPSIDKVRNLMQNKENSYNDNFQNSEDMGNEVEIADNLMKLKRIDGKKCFFFARGMCLCKKARCTIEGDTCDKFISRKSRNLLFNVETCRNLIKYVRKGKVNRVECAVFGLPGCVGPDECQFCLKKKDNKK